MIELHQFFRGDPHCGNLTAQFMKFILGPHREIQIAACATDKSGLVPEALFLLWIAMLVFPPHAVAPTLEPFSLGGTRDILFGSSFPAGILPPLRRSRASARSHY